jgi:hypothetical protein
MKRLLYLPVVMARLVRSTQSRRVYGGYESSRPADAARLGHPPSRVMTTAELTGVAP